MKILWISPIIESFSKDFCASVVGAFFKEYAQQGAKITFIHCSSNVEDIDFDIKHYCEGFIKINVTRDELESKLNQIVIPLQSLIQDLTSINHYDLLIYSEAELGYILRHTSGAPLKVFIPFSDRITNMLDVASSTMPEPLHLTKAMCRNLAYADAVIAYSLIEQELLCSHLLIPVLLIDIHSYIEAKSLTYEHDDAIQYCLEKISALLVSKRKNILFVTNNPVWRAEIGATFRILNWLRYFMQKYRVKIFYTGRISAKEKEKINKLGWAELIQGYEDYIDNSQSISIKHKDIPACLSSYYNPEILKAFKNFLLCHDKFTALIPVNIWHYFYIDILPYHCLTILDAHDIMSARWCSLQIQKELDFTSEQEQAIFNKFSAVAFIEKGEYEYAKKLHGNYISLYCPPDAKPVDLPFPSKGIHFGFVGADFFINTESIQWFIDQVWCLQKREDARLHIFGGVCANLSALPPNVISHGVVEDARAIFAECNVIINPSLRGSGFPTKTLQGLAHGRPVLASVSGARGFANPEDAGIYAARNRAEYIEGMLRLSFDSALRKELSKKALKYVAEYHTFDRCFGSIEELIERF